MIYKSPGVYVEEKASGIRPIAGVGTSTAGFIGFVKGFSVLDQTMVPTASNPATPASSQI